MVSWYAGRLCINRDNEKFFSGPIENNAPGAAVQTKPQSSLLQPPTGPKLGQAGIRMVQADLNSIHRKDGPNANVAPAKLERTPPHLKPPSPAPSRIPVASKAENVPPDNSGNFEGLAGLSSSKWASEAVPGGPKASRLPSKRSKNLLNTPPTDGDEWVKPPPPSTPEEVIAPNDRWKAQITPVSNRGSPHGSSSCRSRTGQLKIEDGPPPQMPFPTHVEIGRDPKTLEDFEARIASMEDEIGGAGVVLSVYLEELEIITNEEISTMKKAEAIKNNKKIKADRVAKQKTLVDIKTATINSLKERRAKLIKEQVKSAPATLVNFETN